MGTNEQQTIGTETELNKQIIIDTFYLKKIYKNFISTKIYSDWPDQYKFQAIHNGGQTEAHIYHNHGNALLAEAAKDV